jgi:hypothetical protein
MPASAYNKANTGRPPRTPVTSGTVVPATQYQLGTPKSHIRGTSLSTRRSSISSFASELETRFNIQPQQPAGPFANSSADPRIIQAITITMVGEYLWKYTRRTGGSLSTTNRHKRFFWVHPYTRTLYWSDHNPTSTLTRAESRNKSAPIEGIEVVNDSNTQPAGLIDKSIIITTTGRKIKVTAASLERHEVWASALAYLLLKTADEDKVTRKDERKRMKNLTEQEIDAYVAPHPPQDIRSESRTARNRFSTASLASRYTSTVGRRGNEVGTMQRSRSMQPARDSSAMSISSRFSSVFRTPGGRDSTVSSRYAGSERHFDTDEEENDPTPRAGEKSQAPMLENVRACCNGKKH